jgi:Holliday junction DNA helicase RuvA
MIEYISGKIATLTPTNVIIDNNGIGYDINITLNSFTELEHKSDAKMFIHEVIRDDAHMLYGFVTPNERTMFRELIGVSGVGVGSARMILSSLPTAELEQIIMSGDDKRLKSVKGIGAKTAQRIIVDLKDKIKPSGDTLLFQSTMVSDAYDEALAALTMLGFAKPQSTKVLQKLFKENPTLKVEQAIKQALTML